MSPKVWRLIGICIVVVHLEFEIFNMAIVAMVTIKVLKKIFLFDCNETSRE